MDVEIIKNQIVNPAYRELASEIMRVSEDLTTGKTPYKVAVAQLSGYKQILQIMALELMRNKINTGRCFTSVSS